MKDKEIDLIDIRKMKRASKLTHVEKEELQRLRDFETNVFRTINAVVSVAYVAMLLIAAGLLINSFLH